MSSSPNQDAIGKNAKGWGRGSVLEKNCFSGVCGGDNPSHKLQQTPAKQNSGLNTAAGKFQNLQKQEQVSNNSTRPPQIQIVIF